MEIDIDSHGAEHLKDTAKVTCGTCSFVLSALAVTLFRVSADESSILEMVGNRANLFLLHLAIVSVLTIVLYYVMRLIGKRSPFWFLWNGPVVDARLDDNEDLADVIDWLKECLPDKAYFIFTAKKRLTIKFKTESDLVFFKMSW